MTVTLLTVLTDIRGGHSLCFGLSSWYHQMTVYRFDIQPDAFNACLIDYGILICVDNPARQRYETLPSTDRYKYAGCTNLQSIADADDLANNEAIFIGQCFDDSLLPQQQNYFIKNTDIPILIGLALGMYAAGYLAGLGVYMVRKFIDAVT